MSAADDLELICSNVLFLGVEQEVIGVYLPEMRILDLADEEIVFEAGDASDGLYLILHGAVRISTAIPGGRQFTLGILQSGDFFGEMGVIEGTPRSARVSANLPARLAHIPGRVFDQILQAAPVEIARNMARGAIRRVRMVNERHLEEAVRAERLSMVGQVAEDIAHDLKNPISRMLGIVKFMEDGEGVMKPEAMAGILRRAAGAMLGLVQDLLDFSRGERSLSLSQTTVPALINDVQDLLLDLLERQRIDFRRKLLYDDTVIADHSVLVRGLINIVKNAAEAVSEGGVIAIDAECAADQVVIRITDNGPGIPESVLPHIFEPYRSFGKKDGTGLGMAITKAAIEAHGGRIAVDSRLGEGTTFEVTIPLSGPMGIR